MNKQKVEKELIKVLNHGWQIVNLRNCGLTEIPYELFSHKNLVSIDLGNDLFADEHERNKITHIPDSISFLKELAVLNIENNEVTNVSEKISELSKLIKLNLQGNKLNDFPEKIANMQGLKELILLDNPFDMIPPEIIVRGIDSIRNFFKELEEKDFIYEVKLIIVGEGRVGKTCLSNALINENYNLEESGSTEGININRWLIPKESIRLINPSIEKDFQINIWDFGGQEIYHSTHQFFLTKRSLYLLVTESRKEDSHDDFFYWLNIIKLLGEKSPVLMVLNKCDQPTKDLPIREYKTNFSNIQSFNKISLKSEFRTEFNDFRQSLIKIASKLPHIGAPLPKVWVDIRRDIEKLKIEGKDYISREEYFQICKNHFRREDSALHLSEYFHDLGVVIHFQDDIDLKDIVFLNHEWITKSVYKILDDQFVIDKKGRFNKNDIIRIWSSEEHRSKTRELLALMKNNKFDLCFEISNGEYLVPRLLPVDEVDYVWETNESNLKFEFRYNFMPKGILSRLIVKMHTDIYQDFYWRYGVILDFEGTKAIIKERYFENKITIELSGPDKRECLFLIRRTLNEIHRDFNKLSFKEMVPCVCDFCKSSEETHFYDFDVLRRYESNNIDKIRCDISLQEVQVYNLTSDIVKKTLYQEKIIFCENKNAVLLNKIGIDKAQFFPERDSASVFIKASTKPDFYGLRDRDFLLDSEIEKIRHKHKNYFILDYYCFENYLYHPDNIESLKLLGFNKNEYIENMIKQKEENKFTIISNFKNARKSYQEFKIEADKFFDKSNEDKIIEYLNSNEVDIFLKAFSLKDKFNKEYLAKYGLEERELTNTTWFKLKIEKLLSFN